MLAKELGAMIVKVAVDEESGREIVGSPDNRFNVLKGPYPKFMSITPPEAAIMGSMATTAPFRGVGQAIGGAAGGIMALRILNKLKDNPSFGLGFGTILGGSVLGSMLTSKVIGD